MFGENLFSINGSQSCASCHQASSAFVDAGRRTSLGAEGIAGTRNTQSLENLAWQTTFFWDGRAASLREQVLQPIGNLIEMHESLTNVVSKLERAGYGPAFAAAFGTSLITVDRVSRALEQYLLTRVSGDSKFDRSARGEEILTSEEQRGFELFQTEYDPRREQFGADCFHCYGGIFFSDFAYHNNGLDLTESLRDTGRAAITGRSFDLGRFKTPSLRNVAITAPYMHDGRFASLEEVVAHYSGGVKRSPTLDPNLAKHPANGISLSSADQRALVAFLKWACFDKTDREKGVIG
ncbi:MAG: cytochrome-c peroxidase [Pedosphaera sp.]|nr:cytochrome-c peroxidase [Pedosphaera sp.]